MKKIILFTIISLLWMQSSFAQCELDPKHPYDLAKLNQIISQGGMCSAAWDCNYPRRLSNLTITAGNLTGNLDLSGCTGLQILNCANNHITSLNLNGCLLLQSINCSNNWISSININGCNSLQAIVCSNNFLTSLDISNRYQLLGVTCPNNKIKDINASYSSSLVNIDCSKNELSVLRLNGCNSLKKLNCKQNKLKNNALTSLYGLNIGQGISNYNLDLRQNIGFTSNAIHKLDSNLQYLSYNQILYDSVNDQFSTELNWETNGISGNPIGVATDGSATIKLTVIRDEGTLVVDSIRIQLQNDNISINEQPGTIGSASSHHTASDTTFTYTQTGINQWEFYYTAPDVFTNTNNSSISRRFVNAVATIYYNNNGMDSSYTYEQKIELIRPPVLLIHGLNDKSKSFENMMDYLYNTNRYIQDQLYCVDYRATNNAPFTTNIGVVSFELKRIKDLWFTKGYEVNKVDIMGHSMGGIISRLYLQSINYRNNIHKLITLNTPHSGSQGANLIIDTWNSIPILRPLILNKVCNGDLSAVNDLQVTSDATRLFLNGNMFLNKNKVPSHAIETESTNLDAIADDNLISYILYLSLKLRYKIIANTAQVIELLMPIMYNGSNDFVVARNSQIGGISPIAFSSITNEWHCGSPKNIYVKSRIKELLELPSTNNAFSMDGFHPPILNWPNTTAPVINQNKSMQLVNTNDSIRLVSPIAGITVTNGQNINVNITGTSGVKNIMLTILESQDSVVLIDTLTSSFNYSYTIPQTACGKINILAIGLDTLGNIFIDSSFINVQPNATPSSIIIDYPEDSLILSQGLLGSIYVNCLFSDSIIREITTLPNVVYSLKTNNAAYISQGVFKGIHPGNDTIMVSYSGLTAKMLVHIGNYYSPTDSIKLYDTICQGNTYNFYGSILDSAGIYDTTFVNQYGGDSIIILNLTVNPLPATAGTISGLATVCQGQNSVTYNVPTIANASSYTWTLPTGATGTSSVDSIVVSYGTSAVSGNITVKGNNLCGIGDSSLISITVNPLPATAGTISGLGTVCQGQNNVTYKVPTIANATSYTWALPTGATGTCSVDSIVVNYSASALSGNITVKGNNLCGIGDSSLLSITVNPLPLAAGTITGLAIVCQGQSSVTYKVPVIANATSYTWALPTGATGTSNVDSIVVSYGTSAVSGNITVKGNNSCGIGDSSFLSITVNPLPVNTGIISGDSIVCQEQNAVTYTIPSIANATSYIWTLPGGATGISDSSNITVNYAYTAISGYITVKAHNSCGNSALASLPINIKPSPLISYTTNPIVPITGCEPLSIVFTNSSAPSNSSYVWDFGDGQTSTMESPTHVFSAGNYAVSLTATTIYGCFKTLLSYPNLIVIHPIPTTPVITQNANTLSSSANNGNQWFNLSIGIINNATAQTYLPQQIGDYFTIVTLNGCSSDSSNIIHYDDTGVDIVESNDAIILYPNPAFDKLFLDLYQIKDFKNANIFIYNMQGQLLLQQTIVQPQTELNISTFAKGVYVVKVNNDRESMVSKFVKN